MLSGDLIGQIKQAINWGIADKETSGYTQEEFVRLLRRALTYIEYLENKVKQLEGK